MYIIPAIDLKDNKCVRLSKGKDETSIVFNNSPKDQAIYFENVGCKKIHIVDLDAAFGRPQINISSIIEIRKSVSIPIQLGGGVRSKDDAKKYFDLGIDNLIIGSMSVNKPKEVITLCQIYENKIYVSLDLKNEIVMVKGWHEKSDLSADDMLKLYNDIPIKGYVITDIENDGMLNGININFVNNVIYKLKSYKSNKLLVIAGGLTNYQDLKNLKKINLKNLEGIIAGKSFYVGNIDLKEAQNILDLND